MACSMSDAYSLDEWGEWNPTWRGNYFWFDYRCG
jgi:hypothetical protein